ncbi:MAG: DUF817 domain-containing protein [Thermomonas sp.]|uniref:DUF817 domain-containing protein n=1 Tax=Thermomonas sp. TaxID=1971895 RepID=UPI001D4E83D3|nr:DUF817 domain-containing protein [Thermomonas sp.]MBZ0087206.1 DUF817 domain-containing protein [Thermomonas sp.]MCO5054142.1 DUF817 domain-containing protein [Thermomonas sp.]
MNETAALARMRWRGIGGWLHALDAWLLAPPVAALAWLPAGLRELLWFGLKEARACLFAGLFFVAVFAMPRAGVFGLPRYDALLLWALAVQAWMLWSKLESFDEFRAICLFHVVGFLLEAYKTRIGMWSYPDFAYSKFLGVPLFSGFMYAAVGSYIIQAWRLLEVRIRHHPPYWMAAGAALLIYANFFTHHVIGDYRWYITALVLGLYARATVVFRPLDRERRMPLLLAFVLIGFFLWLAENLSTFYAIWSYPNQMGAWSRVHLGKWSSWSLLVIMTFTIVAGLKHVKATIHVPED